MFGMRVIKTQRIVF